MESVIIPLLSYSPIKVGLYALFDYIGEVYKLIWLRIGATLASLILNFIYIIVYSYILYDFYNTGSKRGFDYDRKINIICAVISIICLTVIFLLTYYSIDKDKLFCNKIKNSDRNLFYIEKTLMLVYIGWIVYMCMNIVKSYKKLKKGRAGQVKLFTFKNGGVIGLCIITSALSVLKFFQLKYLLDSL